MSLICNEIMSWRLFTLKWSGPPTQAAPSCVSSCLPVSPRLFVLMETFCWSQHSASLVTTTMVMVLRLEESGYNWDWYLWFSLVFDMKMIIFCCYLTESIVNLYNNAKTDSVLLTNREAFCEHFNRTEADKLLTM